MITLFRLFIPLLLLVSCNTTPSDAQNAVLTVEDFDKKWKSDPKAQLLDVRTPQEYAAGHLKSALNYDYNGGNFETQIATLDKSRPVLVYCAVGGRSARSAARLRALGFKEVYDLKGGYTAWKAAGKPSE
jgi:rhodanese-related sulfurtransferase